MLALALRVFTLGDGAHGNRGPHSHTRRQFLSGSHATPNAISVETCSTAWNIFLGFFDGGFSPCIWPSIDALAATFWLRHWTSLLHTRLIHCSGSGDEIVACTLTLICGSVGISLSCYECGACSRGSVCWDFHCCYSLLLLLLLLLLFIHIRWFVRPVCVRLMLLLPPPPLSLTLRCSLFVYMVYSRWVSRLPLGMLCASVWHHDASLCRGSTFSHLRMFEREAYYPLVRT